MNCYLTGRGIKRQRQPTPSAYPKGQTSVDGGTSSAQDLANFVTVDGDLRLDVTLPGSSRVT
jgi:hypothetical protein